jgi:hypothetical protein
MGWYAKQRALDRIRVAAAEGLDLVSFWEEAAAAIRPAVRIISRRAGSRSTRRRCSRRATTTTA